MSSSRTITTHIEQSTLDRIVSGLMGLRFGTLEIVVHDSKIVRITRSEKVRLDAADGPPSSKLSPDD